MQEYIKIYHKLLKFKDKDKVAKAEEIRVRLTEIEKNYRTDFIQQLRKLMNERYYGLKK